MSTIIDFHSHILPGIDDGSSSVDESMAMLYMERDQGVSQIVATPHFYACSDDLGRFLKRRSYAEKQLREEMAKHPGLPGLIVGAEVSYFPGMANSDAIAELAIENSKYILIEMPFSTWTDSMYSELQKIHDKQGLIPIVAHIDRYVGRFNYHRVIHRLEGLPVIVQSNAEAFLEKRTASLALWMLKNGRIHVLGSDCHNTFSRPPNLGNALQVIHNKIGVREIERILCYGDGLFAKTHNTLAHSAVK